MLNRLFCSCSSWLLEDDLYVCVMPLLLTWKKGQGNGSREDIYAHLWPLRWDTSQSFRSHLSTLYETLDQLFSFSGPQYVIFKLKIMALLLDLWKDIMQLRKLKIEECKEFAWSQLLHYPWPRWHRWIHILAWYSVILIWPQHFYLK